jgi:hypothetical protein
MGSMKRVVDFTDMNERKRATKKKKKKKKNASSSSSSSRRRRRRPKRKKHHNNNNNINSDASFLAQNNNNNPIPKKKYKPLPPTYAEKVAKATRNVNDMFEAFDSQFVSVGLTPIFPLNVAAIIADSRPDELARTGTTLLGERALSKLDTALFGLEKKVAEVLGIPGKCSITKKELRMHLDYIQNNLWETRDMKRAHEIRDRYSKKGNIMCVYKFENLINGKVYIGQTKNFWNRVKKHLSPKSLNYDKADLYRAIRKHGIENFEVSILYDSLQVPRLSIERERLLMEAVMVERYDSFINGYNVQPTTTDPHERHKIATDPRYFKTYRSLSYDQL